jgi:hypothetical protein
VQFGGDRFLEDAQYLPVEEIQRVDNDQQKQRETA